MVTQIWKGRGKNKMTWILCGVAFLVVATIIFFYIPYSKTKNDFQKDVRSYKERTVSTSEVFSEQDIALLPEPVQAHFRACGYIGTPKMTSMTAYMSSVPLRESNDKPPMIIDYTLFLFADEPVRLAYIKTSMFGIPFEGYDSTQNGVGFMKGVIGKIFTLFNQTGPEMDKGQLITYLGECFLIPSSILNGYITWEPIDAVHAKATIAYQGISASGVFTFGDDGFLKSFQTEERGRTGADGTIDYPKWSGVYENFTEKNGVFYPENAKAVYHEDAGDLIYFDARNINITFEN